MNRYYLLPLAAALSLAWWAEAPSAEGRGWVDELRQQVCGASPGSAKLRAQRRLDEAARRWSRGTRLRDALLAAGYRADGVYGLKVTGPGPAVREQLRRDHCQQLRSAAYRDVGLFERGDTRWIILASAYEAPKQSDADRIARDALRLANQARSRSRSCGAEHFPAAGPLRLSPALNQAAAAHAADMARRDELDHRGSNGSTASQRVRAAGYQPRRVGENIASGPVSAAEAMDGWIASPDHCSNLMNEGFTEMGLAFADSGPDGRLYWVQLLAAPR